jgi:surface protein
MHLYRSVGAYQRLHSKHRFQGARIFNRDISRWKTGNVLDMSHMFQYAARLHINSLSSWDTSRVTSMSFMFASASHFNGELDWNVARVQHFHGMFQNADLFNAGGPALWDVSGAIDKLPIDPDADSYGFVSMFEGAKDFNQDISHWDMRYALKLDFMFRVSGA